MSRMSKAARRMANGTSRASAGGGREVALSSPATSQNIVGPADEWFGPGRPMAPIAPRSTAGRRFDYNFGTNYNTTPRQETGTSFQMLRLLADGHDLTRLAIETRKDQMSRLKFGFGLVDSDEDLTPEQDARALQLKILLRRPDGDNFWVDWLRQVLEDLLVIDAPSIFVRRTMDESTIVGLYQIDGATVKPVIDAGGRTPEYPQTAYQQVLHGMPAVDYTSRDLVYRPRNRRVHTVYGFSPVEQIMATINIALRRQMWQHAYFTNGNLPDSLIGVPSTWTPDQIRDFQDWFDALLTGNTERRRGALFVPGEVAKSYVPTKDAEMFGAAEEWLARVVCFCFGISHQALVKEVNRATAHTAQDQALDDGLAPIMGWVKSLMDGILIDQFGETELEFRWLDDKETDPAAQDALWKGRVDSGTADRNEWRAAVGLDPRPEAEASALTTASTVTMLSVDASIEQQQRRQESGVFPTPPDPNAPPGKDDTSSGSGGSEGTDGVGAEGEASKSASSTLNTGEVADGDRPFAVAGVDVSKVSAPRPYNADQLTEAQVEAFGKLSPERHAVEVERVRLQAVLERAFARVRRRVVPAVRAELQRLSSGVSKADEPDTLPPGGAVTPLAEAFSFSEFVDQITRVAIDAVGSLDFIIDATSSTLEAIAEDASRQVIGMIGPSLGQDIVDQVSERSVLIAEERAAELVGRRVLASGEIIDNPSARWAISDSTRTMIRDDITRILRDNEGSDAIIQQLEDVHAFSPARAEMVSRTEVAAINSDAQMETYHVAQDAGVNVKKEWLLGPEPCEICEANAAQGPIDLNDSFDSGDDTAPAHPNCVCAVVPVVGEE